LFSACTGAIGIFSLFSRRGFKGIEKDGKEEKVLANDRENP
jgi:hypothetical protein